MDADGHTVLWNKDDRISLFDGEDNNVFIIDESSIKGSEASFTGKVRSGAERFVALYPYSESAGFSGLSFSACLPSEQTPVAGSFDPACGLAAAVSENESLVFHNLVSLFKVTLGAEHSDVKAIRISGNAAEKLSGEFRVEMDMEEGIKTISPGDATQISVSGELSAAGSYYLAAIGGITFRGGFTVTLEFSNGLSTQKVIDSQTELLPGTIISVDMSGVACGNLFGSDVLSVPKGGKIEYTLAECSDVTLKTGVPSGWAVSVSMGNKVTITAPASEKDATLSGTVSFTCRTAAGIDMDETVQLRLSGINNLQDFKDFRTANMNGGDVAPYLSGGKVVLNADLEIGPDDMTANGTCFMYSLAYPLEGSGKTITITNSTTGEMNALFGYLRAGVSNLKLAGSLSASNALCRMAPLAAYCGEYPTINKTLTISNVESSVDVSYSNKSTSSSQIAGLVAVCTGVDCTVSFVNCIVRGKVSTSQSILDTGGFVGRGESGTPGVVVTFTDCEFAGEIVYNQTAIHSNPRVGGFVASGERRTKYTRCANNGKITANLNNKVFDPDGGGGLGGILGRSSKVTSGYNMGWYLNDVSTSCTITINGQPSGATTAYFGKIIGSKQDEAQQYANVTEGGSLIINYY